MSDDYCRECDLDLHVCPGCGEPLRHGQGVCRPCDAEHRREFRVLLDASSLGSPGVKARIRRSEGHTLTPDEQAAADQNERELDRAMRRPWRR